MNKVKGFTLIELIIVIVLLGILSATAAPRFLNLQSDARKAALKALQGAIKEMDTQVLGKSIVNSIERFEQSQIKLDNLTLETRYGHLLVTEPNIENALDMSGYTIFGSDNSDSSGPVSIYVGDFGIDAQGDPVSCRLDVFQGDESGLAFELLDSDC